jgi:hypothetical protein
MRNSYYICVLALAALAPTAFAQTPDGTDIAHAIPLILGQTISDVGDVGVAPARVYSIGLAKGQQFTAALTATGGSNLNWNLDLLAPTAKSVYSLGGSDVLFNYARGSAGIVGYDTNNSMPSITYQVAASATYYILVSSNSAGISFNLNVTATGAPLGLPNPPSAGCLTGTVDYITYSAQLIGYNLPDEVSIGGTKACASCNVKAPQYPALASRLDLALAYNVSVKACYDAGGNIFQLTLSNQ